MSHSLASRALTRHIGILGHSADGAALCFLEMVREASRRLGAHYHPEITLSILPMGAVLEQYERHAFPDVRAHLTRTARRLADAACDFFVCPDNTAHVALELPGEPLPLPGLHIAEITPELSPLATLDSTRLLAREAVAVALGERTPEWRGGPVPMHSN